MPTTALISAPSADVVWVLVGGQALFFSSDQGSNFRRASLPGQIPIESMTFVDEHTGWILSAASPATQCQSQSIALWQTVDGGSTWRQLAIHGIDERQCKQSVTFVDSTHGYIAAWDDNHAPAVYATADGGMTWRGTSIPDGPLFVTANGGFTLHVDWIKRFGSILYLQASGAQNDPTWSDRAFIYTSVDDGATWNWKQKLFPLSHTVMLTEQRWIQYQPDIEETVNGGQQFHPYATDMVLLSPSVDGTEVVFADATIGYATGRGQIERSLDGGAHWTMIATPGT